FKALLPPLRYVNTEFRHYPIVLSAPGVAIKTRWVSNGSGVNLRANKKPMWKEAGVPVRFFVGEDAKPFGEDLAQLNGPRYERGYLPIVQITYSHEKAVYEQEAFAPIRKPWSDAGTVFLRFTARNAAGFIRAQIAADSVIKAQTGTLRHEQGEVVA